MLEAPLERDSTGGSNIQAILQAYALCKAIGGFARRRGVMVITGNVKTVRKAFLGRGDISGDEAKRQVKRMCEAIGWAPPNLDCADASALLWWASEKWAPGCMPPVSPPLHRGDGGMTARVTALPWQVQRVVGLCLSGQILVLVRERGRTAYRVDPWGKPITAAAAEAAIASGHLIPASEGLFGAETAQSWRARRSS